jgi:uncharacterized protein YjlB
MSEPQTFRFEPDEGIPNNSLPLVCWKGRLPGEARSGGGAAALFLRNGWQGTWVYTVFPYWHFHTRGHEALACVSGRARIGFGGDHGITTDVEQGDVCVIPGGVGHKRVESSEDFQMAGCYPPGQEGDIVKPGDIAVEAAAQLIARLALPETDPITGLTDGVVAAWRMS